jgi:hypothetical protein
LSFRSILGGHTPISIALQMEELPRRYGRTVQWRPFMLRAAFLIRVIGERVRSPLSARINAEAEASVRFNKGHLHESMSCEGELISFAPGAEGQYPFAAEIGTMGDGPWGDWEE